MSEPRVIRTRFAPSPSGHLHVGGARTALYCWAYAKKRGGRFILRIEDTDQKRSSTAASVGFLEDLAWLGITWDEGPEHDGSGGGDFGPYYQSERLEIYRAHVDRLIAEGKAYRAFETPEELEAARKLAHRDKRNYRYDRAALALDVATVERYVAEGRPHVVRFKVPEGDVVVQDEVRGEVRVSREELDDFVILKADGYPTYHFAVVVDDELMQVTHIIRGEEHLNNTLRHALLQDAFGFRRPVYAHISLIFNPDGSKMSKRDKDKALRAAVRERGARYADLAGPESPEAMLSAADWDAWLGDSDRQLDPDAAETLARRLGVALPEINVDDFRRAGYLPEVLTNYLALLGWSPGGDVERFDRRFLVDQFDFDRVIRSAARFDRDKLLAFNLEALKEMPPAEFVDRLRAHMSRYHPEFAAKLDGEAFRIFAEANQGRSKKLEDPFHDGVFFITSDDRIEYEQSKAVRKALLNGEPTGYACLEGVLPALRDLPDWTVESVEHAVRVYADAHADGKLGKVAQPLRIAVSGGTVSPAIFETLVILGKQAVIKRIERCLACREVIAQS